MNFKWYHCSKLFLTMLPAWREPRVWWCIRKNYLLLKSTSHTEVACFSTYNGGISDHQLIILSAQSWYFDMLLVIYMHSVCRYQVCCGSQSYEMASVGQKQDGLFFFFYRIHAQYYTNALGGPLIAQTITTSYTNCLTSYILSLWYHTSHLISHLYYHTSCQSSTYHYTFTTIPHSSI